MIAIYYKSGTNILKSVDKEDLGTIPTSDIVWIDLNFPRQDEQQLVEEIMHVNLHNRQQAEEIEISSKYIELENAIIINSSFLVESDAYLKNETVTFILKDNWLITYRNADLKAFKDTVKKFKANMQSYYNGFHFLVSLFEHKIDLNADLLEDLSKEITSISKTISLGDNLDESLLLKINNYQERTMVLRENIIDKQRIVSAMLRSEAYPTEVYNKLRILIKDISSILDHSSFNFERLEYIQNTFLGLVDLQQNKIIKIFTVVSVIFLPPTLIASVYGMNFHKMPELDWEMGYPFAIFLMVLSSVTTLLVFRRKRWL
ncbi:MAG TPA: magnesium/cobalt transporter CorA [Cytophagaceae bacterium]